jgi:hypothetical protein
MQSKARAILAFCFPGNSMAAIIVVAVIVLLLIAIVTAVRSKNRGSGIALTAFQDLQAKDKQQAIEVILEQQEHKKLKEQESGEASRMGSTGDAHEPQ